MKSENDLSDTLEIIYQVLKGFLIYAVFHLQINEFGHHSH